MNHIQINQEELLFKQAFLGSFKENTINFIEKHRRLSELSSKLKDPNSSLSLAVRKGAEAPIDLSFVGKKRTMEKTAESVVYAAFIQEMQKLAEDPDRKEPEPPKWLSRAAEAGGFIMGAGIGSALGDTLIAKAMKSPSPNTIRLAKGLGAGAVGMMGMMLTPKIQQMTDKYLYGKGRENAGRNNSN